MVGRLTEMKDHYHIDLCSLQRDNKLIAKIFFEISIEKRIDYIAFERDAVQVAEKHWSGGSSLKWILALDGSHHKCTSTQSACPTAFTMFSRLS